MDTRLILTATILASLSAIFASDPLHFSTIPSLSLTSNELQNLEIIGCAIGPESLAFDPNGEGPYVGVADGRILQWQGQDDGWANFAVTSPLWSKELCNGSIGSELEQLCGRPLGLRFSKTTGKLYIADAYFGLMVVGPRGGLAKSLAKQAEGQPFVFTNDMDIDEEEGVIYFTDTSTKFQRWQFTRAMMTGDKTGRLMRYKIATNEVRVLLRGLSFANGVVISMDRSFLLIAETTTRRILRLWLSGPNEGNLGVFVELPGSPDNIRRNSKGEFWVAVNARRSYVTQLAISNAWVGKLILKFSLCFKGFGWQPYGLAMRLGEEGHILEVLEDWEGKTLTSISEVDEKDGDLWIGSVTMPFVRIYKL